MGYRLSFHVGRRILTAGFEGHVAEASLCEMSAFTRRLVERPAFAPITKP